MGFARAWKPSGDAKYSAVAGKKDGSALRLSFRASTQEPDAGLGFPRRNRLTRGPDIQAVIQQGKRVRTVHLDVRIAASPVGFPRVAIVVPRHRQSAVDRNRLKRRIRDLVRTQLLPTLRTRPSLDVAFRARREAYGADVASLRADVEAVRRHIADETP
jgi:ribonuclease P protein component